MASHAEIERKYEVDEAAVLPQLGELVGSTLGGATVGSVALDPEATLEAQYFDTASFALARRRIALRRREGGSDGGWHLKLPAEEGRTESQWPLDAELRDGAVVPAEVLEPVRGIVRDHPLSVIATVRTRRTTTRLLDVDGGGLVELADDVVRATDAASGETRVWREWEAELLDAAPDTRAGRETLLDAVEARLLAAGAAPSRSSSKLASALGRTGLGEAATPATLDRASAASEVLLVTLRALVDEVVRLDPLVRQDAPDAVHQLRTRVRRIRSVLGSYRDVFDEAVTGPLRHELRQLGAVLGGARDAEVMRDRAAALLDDHAGFAPSVRDRVVGGQGEKYEAAYADVVAELSGERYFRLLDDLDALIARPALGSAAFSPAASVVPAVLSRELERVRRRAKRADAAESDLDRTERLHATRKAAKRLRYAAEAVSAGDAAIFGARVRRAAAAAERVHDLLGEHRDSVLLQEHLRRVAPNSRRAFDFGVLHELERHAAAMCLAEYPAAMKELRKAARRLRR